MNLGDDMNSLRIVALVLIVAGILGLAYGGFTYTKETHQTKIGPFEMSVNEKETINIPVWAGIGAIVLGGGLLFMGSRKT
jgi:multidrug transporter EmrE-like cation transporter